MLGRGATFRTLIKKMFSHIENFHYGTTFFFEVEQFDSYTF